MISDIKHKLVHKTEADKTLAEFVKELKQKKCSIISFTRELQNEQTEVISIPFTEDMPASEFEKINKKVEELMEQGFALSKVKSDIHAVKKYASTNLMESIVSFPEFKK